MIPIKIESRFSSETDNYVGSKISSESYENGYKSSAYKSNLNIIENLEQVNPFLNMIKEKIEGKFLEFIYNRNFDNQNHSLSTKTEEFYQIFNQCNFSTSSHMNFPSQEIFKGIHKKCLTLLEGFMLSNIDFDIERSIEKMKELILFISSFYSLCIMTFDQKSLSLKLSADMFNQWKSLYYENYELIQMNDALKSEKSTNKEVQIIL